ncbi:MAG: hypothetical protein JSW26_08530 [Desulfobacterales bacterium]|nr:MAG: hypothetical protein JSW26_08530 [Desulfobacterales bacterium]
MKNNSPAGNIALYQLIDDHKSSNDIQIPPRSGCGFSFAAIVYIPLFLSGAQRQMKK